MGQAASSFDPRFTRSWANLEGMTTDTTRLQAVDMLLGSPEYINAAKRAGIYADFLPGALRNGVGNITPGLGHMHRRCLRYHP